eukprot:CAMPEP_0180645278 /NCGR_PEP_ID=MMETSP1037_2-20121125/48895_1 /TAXON_ID=632150 /ORGANISM="Azadinium spinosum, Strain 3D9" /LENGTH=388 /DNA_ID=CAMNT_0022669107 /DNA_START=37 /DNA_END=1203 /DNA_ORIENTATION=+
MTAVSMVIPTRAPMILKIKNGDAALTAKTMGLMSTFAALIELFVNPVLGKLSDQCGRKPFLMLAPIVNCILHGLVAAFPSSLPMQFVDRMISGSMIFGFGAPAQAAMADMYGSNPKRLGEMAASAGMYFGIGCTVGPFIGSKIGAKMGGGASFFASAVAFLATFLYAKTVLKETLPEESKKVFRLSDVNPMAFLKLFKTKTLGLLTSTAALQSFGDYLNVYDINNLFMIKVLGYEQGQIGNFATTAGASQVLGGKACAMIIKATSLKTATVFSNIMWAIGMSLMGSARSTAQAFTALLAFWTFGHQRATPVGSYIQKHGAEQGMGRAEIVAAQGNLTAYVKVIVPLLYSSIFAWATSNGRNIPGLPYFVIATLTAISQFVFWSAAPED